MSIQPTIHRRLVLGSAIGLAASLPRPPSAQPGRIKAIAFDGFVIIDPRPVALRAEALFPGQGARLMEIWRSRQFEYTWLRTLSRRYVDLWQVTQEALVFAARAAKLDLAADQRDALMQAFLELKAWPDVAPVLRDLKDRDIRMAFLANPTVKMFDAVVRNSGLEGLLEEHLSTDRVQAYKPDPRTYQMGIDAFGLAREEIAFAASASWDAAGAKAFGYPTIWVNRAGLPQEYAEFTPHQVLPDLRGVASLI